MSHYTVKEVSEKLGISQSLVYREIRDGRLKCHCFGRRAYRISEAALAAYVEACSQQRALDVDEIDTPEIPRGVKEKRSRLFRHIDVSRLLARRS